MKKTVVGMVASLLSMGAHAQLSSLLQGVQQQVTQAAQTEANRGARAATDKAIQSAKTQSVDAYNAVRPASASEGQGQTVRPE
jgi:hypothetical protein